jgi:hypothetical protein
MHFLFLNIFYFLQECVCRIADSQDISGLDFSGFKKKNLADYRLADMKKQLAMPTSGLQLDRSGQ